MCLDKVLSREEFIEKFGTPKQYEKLFSSKDGQLVGFIINSDKILPRGVWLNERDYRPDLSISNLLKAKNGDLYIKGFHVWAFAEKMEPAFLNTVEVNRVHAYGEEGGEPVIVVDQIKIKD